MLCDSLDNKLYVKEIILFVDSNFFLKKKFWVGLWISNVVIVLLSFLIFDFEIFVECMKII